MFISPTLPPKAAPRSSSTRMRCRTGLGWALSLQPPPFPTDGSTNKTQNLTPVDVAYDSPFTHMIAESRHALPAGRWEIVEVIDRFAGWKVLRDVPGVVREKGLKGLWDVLGMKEDKLWIFERGTE